MNVKVISKELKAIRRNIARENDIDLEIPECTFKGSCAGTCPRCEMEARLLENELSKRLSLGKVATVAGLALTLAGGVQAATVPSVEPLCNPLPECELQVRPNAGLECKEYEVVFSMLGYYKHIIPGQKPQRYRDGDAVLEITPEKVALSSGERVPIVVGMARNPFIEISPGNSSMQTMQVEGVKVRVLY